MAPDPVHLGAQLPTAPNDALGDKGPPRSGREAMTPFLFWAHL